MNEKVQENEPENNYDAFLCTYYKICDQLKINRKQSGSTIEMVSKWLEVDKRKIIDLENHSRIDMKLLYSYANIFDIKLNFNFKVY